MPLGKNVMVGRISLLTFNEEGDFRERLLTWLCDIHNQDTRIDYSLNNQSFFIGFSIWFAEMEHCTEK